MAVKTNCTKNGVNYFRVTATVGYDQKGKRIRKEFYGASQKEALKARDEYLAKIESGLDIDLSQKTLSDAMSTWLFEVKKVDNDLKASSFARYENAYRVYVKDSKLGLMKVSYVKSMDIQMYLNNLAELNPTVEQKAGQKPIGCTNAQLKNVYKILKMFFIYATEEGYTIKNPCSRKIAIPGEKPKKQEVETFTDEEVDKIKSTLVDHRMRLPILMALGTGMRRGELLALKYEDITNGVVKVHSSLARPFVVEKDGTKTYDFVIWEPKSQSSNREIPIPTELQKEIDAHRVRQIAERLALGIGGEPEFLFTTETNNFIDPTNFCTAYSRILKRAGVTHKKFHALRHTYATRLVRAGVDLPTIQRLMGHSDIAMTSIYTHANLDERKIAVQKLNALFK